MNEFLSFGIIFREDSIYEIEPGQNQAFQGLYNNLYIFLQ